ETLDELSAQIQVDPGSELSMSAESSASGKSNRPTSRQAHADPVVASLIEDTLAWTPSSKSVLVIGVGGSSVKILASGQSEIRSFPSGPMLTPGQMVARVKKFARDWR